ncbi:LRRIQ4 [Branchiostoma lanceolatum]|uniref:Leucine-rich repeat protein SHOC-2 n=1 Tax=Branchiostoma lanceolatum TaxID=7740 RepID=A0A8K0A4K4_BRALA|nr:LRRIQ4 [Branchiostoma lanceolatum]
MEEKEKELRDAAGRGDEVRVQQLLAEGVSVNAEDSEVGTALHLASEKGHTGTVQALLTAGANVEARDKLNWTPLHEAADRGHPECVKVLLKAGANTVIRTGLKKTAEELAEQEDVLEVFELFKGKTSALTMVEAYHCRLTSIPEEIGQLQKLRELRLDNNMLTQLPQAITTLPNLQYIDLSWNKIDTLPDGFSRLQLRQLYLLSNRFKEIPEEVCSLLQLDTFSVSYNPLKCLPDKISQLRGLRTMYMSRCQFDEFPRQVLQLEGLERLYMGNWAGEGNPSPVPEDIGRLRNLQVLGLRDGDLESLPDGVGELLQLTDLDVALNRFTSVPEQITNLSSIRKLDLSKNRISHLPLTLKRLAQLEDMDISGNPLIYPPPDVCKKGTAAIMEFLRREIKNNEERELRKHVYRFSRNVTEAHEVKALSGALGLTSDQITKILDNDSNDPSLQAHKALLMWIETYQEASMAKLQQELSDFSMDRLAEEAGRFKAERLKPPADTSGGPPTKQSTVEGSSRVGHQEGQQTKEKIRQAEQKLVQMQHHSEIQQAMVSSLRAEVTRLMEKDERAQKVLLDHKQEVQQLQEANVAMASQVDNLLQDNEKIRSQVVLLGGEQHESEMLTKLSCRLGSDWRRLGAKLGIPEPRLDNIQQAGYNNAIQRACKVLAVWMCGGEHGLPHDLKQLETVLVDMDRADLLDIVRTAYQNYIKEMSEVKVEPEASAEEEGVTIWSVELPGRGKYVCKHTDLGVVTPCPVQLTYRTVNPSEHWPENEDWELIGPLFHIKCNHGDDVPVELLLPHILDLSQEDGSALTSDEAKAAHVLAGNTTLHPANVTPTHFITRHQKGSLWAAVLRKLRALSVNRRGLFTLFKTSQTPHGVDIKAHIVSNTKGIMETLQEDLSKLHPMFYPWDSIPCSFRPHQVYCLLASVENGTLAHAEPRMMGRQLSKEEAMMSANTSISSKRT